MTCASALTLYIMMYWDVSATSVKEWNAIQVKQDTKQLHSVQRYHHQHASLLSGNSLDMKFVLVSCWGRVCLMSSSTLN